jgi:phytanoyl-CoA hydroxylase
MPRGSALNTSNRSRNLPLYEAAAADAWPLMDVKDFDEFNNRMIQGATTIEPRVTPVPVRMPLAPALRHDPVTLRQNSPPPPACH